MSDLEPPPRYVEYPRPHFVAQPKSHYDTDLSASWAFSMAGICLSPLVGIFGMIYVNRAVVKGHPKAKLSRALQIAILIACIYPWLLFAASGIGMLRTPIQEQIPAASHV